MDRFFLPSEIEAVIADLKIGPTCLNNDQIAEFTKLHIDSQRTAASSVRAWNATYPKLAISEQVASKYIRYYKANNTYCTVAKRGPKELLSEGKAADVVSVLLLIRERGVPVDAGLVSRVARGLYARNHGTLSIDIAGFRMFSKSWATRFLHKNNFKVRAATGDRTVSGKHIIEVGGPFYETIKGIKNMSPRLIFNVDEFFCNLETGANSTQTWTWERVASKKQNVIVRTDRVGFTCSVLTNCAGEVVLFQIIWKGKTDLVHVSPSQIQFPRHVEHPAVYQTHREDTHFQSEETWKAFLARFIREVDKIRGEFGDHTAPAALLIDAAGQHNGTVSFLEDSGIQTIEVPKKCTHVFQPADMYIISNIKQHAKVGWNRYIEDVYRTLPVEAATNVVTDAVIEGRKKTPYKRELKYSLLCGALRALSAETIIASWEAAGIRRALGMEPVLNKAGEQQPVFFDTYIEIEKITQGAEHMDPVVAEGEDDEDEEEEYKGDVVDPTAPLNENVVHEHVPQAPPAPAEGSKAVRRPGRPQIRPPPVAPKHSLQAFFATAPKRPREEAIDVELVEPR
jgi:hypothetical protein